MLLRAYSVERAEFDAVEVETVRGQSGGCIMSPSRQAYAMHLFSRLARPVTRIL
jgi:hypothetical protein